MTSPLFSIRIKSYGNVKNLMKYNYFRLKNNLEYN